MTIIFAEKVVYFDNQADIEGVIVTGDGNVDRLRSINNMDWGPAEAGHLLTGGSLELSRKMSIVRPGVWTIDNPSQNLKHGDFLTDSPEVIWVRRGTLVMDVVPVLPLMTTGTRFAINCHAANSAGLALVVWATDRMQVYAIARAGRMLDAGPVVFWPVSQQRNAENTGAGTLVFEE
ncbi:MAG: hypothetical protein JWM57_173 [Phycisphaerales bacterium]|nr:hypothetical protein [Phycisphaerales bacterium]